MSSKPSLHIVGLPHTQITKDYVACSYTQKHLKLCTMMHKLGYGVYSYAGEENEAQVSEHIPVVKKEQQSRWFGDHDFHKEFFNITWGGNEQHWVEMNNKAIEEIKKRIQPGDIICLIAGHCQKQIADAFPEHISVEYGIGYHGIFSDYKVFESYSHMHYVYGEQKYFHGKFYDAVIHNYFDPADFQLGSGSGGYLLWMGRFIETKGPEIAVQVAKRLGVPLVMAGQGAVQEGDTVKSLDGSLSFTGDISHVGHVDAIQRSALMGEAIATIMPTTYIEPFGGVSIESMMCGTPVVASDFGAFTETVKHPAGRRFRTIGEAVNAVEKCSDLSRPDIRRYAVENFSSRAASYKYDMYFQQLGTLWEDGFYSDWFPIRERFENA